MSEEMEWEYSRNQRRHTTFNKQGREAFQIRSCAPEGSHQGKYGYELFRGANDKGDLGELVNKAQTVKELKQVAKTYGQYKGNQPKSVSETLNPSTK